MTRKHYLTMNRALKEKIRILKKRKDFNKKQKNRNNFIIKH